MEKTRTAGTMRYVFALVLAVAVLCTVRLFAYATAEEGGTIEVTGDTVNVRDSAGTGGNIVGKASAGQTYTVLGSTTGTDNQLWYNITIDGKNGYIRSDFVRVTEVGGETTAEGGEGEGEGGETPAETSTENGSDVTSSITTTSYTATALEPETEPPVIPEGFHEVKLTVAGADDIRGWSDDVFTIFYGSDPSGYTGWFLYETSTNRYVRYTDFLLAAGSGSEESGGSGAKGVNIFLVVLCIALAIACVLLGIRAFGSRDDDDYDDDDDDDDEEDYRPSRRTAQARPAGARPAQGQQARPQRSAAPQRGEGAARPAQGQARPQRSGAPQRGEGAARPAQGQARPQRSGAPQRGEGAARPAQGQARPQRSGAPQQAPSRRSSAQQVRQSRPVEEKYDDFDDED